MKDLTPKDKAFIAGAPQRALCVCPASDIAWDFCQYACDSFRSDLAFISETIIRKDDLGTKRPVVFHDDCLRVQEVVKWMS